MTSLISSAGQRQQRLRRQQLRDIGALVFLCLEKVPEEQLSKGNAERKDVDRGAVAIVFVVLRVDFRSLRTRVEDGKVVVVMADGGSGGGDDGGRWQWWW